MVYHDDLRADARRALAVSVVAVLAFLTLAWFVFDGDGAQLDLQFAEHMTAWRVGLLTPVFRFLSFVGNTSTLFGVGAILLLVGMFRRAVRLEAFLVVALLLLVWGVSAALKLLFNRARPAAVLAISRETSHSFPSGHAMVSLCVLGFIAYLIASHLRYSRRGPALVALGMGTLLIGFSRLYLGVHFVSDVLGGYLAGIPLLAVAIVAHRAMVRQGGSHPSDESGERHAPGSAPDRAR